MAIIIQDFGNIGGGTVKSGNTVTLNGSEVSEITTSSTEFTVDTGLSSIKRFMLTGNVPLDTTNSKMQYVIYDAEVYSEHQNSILDYAGQAQGYVHTVPYASLNGLAVSIKSITNGVITLTTNSSRTYGAISNIHWMAE